MPHFHHRISPFSAAAVLLIALVYVRGWIADRSNRRNAIPAWRAGSFLGGLLLIWIAVGSPLAALDHKWLTVHMIQHLLLMSLGPPLLWLGAPAAALRFRVLSQPTVCWIVATVVLMGWHVPAIFALGMRSPEWHAVQRASFLASGLLFWLPVVQPATGSSADAQWSIIVYLFLAMLPCDILSGFLTFSDRVAYSTYLSTTQRSAASVLADQACAGAVMWTTVTIVYLVVGTILTTQWLGRPHWGASAHRDPRTAGAA